MERHGREARAFFLGGSGQARNGLKKMVLALAPGKGNFALATRGGVPGQFLRLPKGRDRENSLLYFSAALRFIMLIKSGSTP